MAAGLVVVALLVVTGVVLVRSAVLPVGGATSSTDQGTPETSQDASGTATSGAAQDPDVVALAWGPTVADLREATAEAAALPLERAAGGVLVSRYQGSDATAAAAQVAELGLAGVLLFGDNVVSPEQVRASTDLVKEAGASDGRSWPVVVGVDQEGGVVQRLGEPWTQMPSFLAAGAAVTDDPAAGAAVVRDAARAGAAELRGSGFTVNFAPVADVTVGPADVTVGTRSAGSDPQTVATAATAAAEGLLEGGVLPGVKHFPGHGSVTTDSHVALPVQGATAAELAARDLVPFVEAVNSGAPMIMVSHVSVTAWDPGVPASLSAAAYDRLRTDLGFTGVAVTDSLDMGGVADGRTPEQVAVQALGAGADLLLTPTDVVAARDGIVAAVQDGTLPRERLDEALGRVVAMMRWQQKLADRADMTLAAGPDAVGTASDSARALGDASVTVVAGRCAAPLVGQRLHVRGGNQEDWDAFAAAAGRAGLAVVPLTEPADTTVRLLPGESTVRADVDVALGWPTVLASSTAPVQVATYGRTRQTFDATLAVLTGRQSAQGSLPVAVGRHPVGTGC
ncbi:glycoside hydrolase family 3 N-terminal domain-containing protein [Sanguibacter suaedae]|uniref:glycoside hydrolase family 3 N-terminal domain-containing protein n=1 Tax=Sanguibacter suaedae TaxID=2795737 RepID=UPI001E59BC88|nr:glycoside hydrolase family 3 N-terminal domain-containing protein [Sanguibacter suaedae]